MENLLGAEGCTKIPCEHSDSRYCDNILVSLHDVEANNARRTALLQKQKKALESALHLAEQGNRAKNTFLANMSHDFRTPMNAITGFADIALANITDTACVEDCLRKILVSSGHLLDLVNDILDVSRIESGKLSVNAQPMTLDRFMNATYEFIEGVLSKKNITFNIDYSDLKHNHIIADRMRLSQIFTNLLNNAIKFTPSGGTITFTLTERARAPKGYGRYQFKVADTGCGMSPEFLKRVFEPFARSEDTISQHTEGTGLGTTIVHSLVDLMGGSVDVTSELGKGTTFLVSLPLQLDPDVHMPVEKEANAHREAAPDTQENKSVHFAGKRALIADDDELSREVLLRILQRYGFEVVEVGDGEAAISAMRTSMPRHFDVLLFDLRMPGIGGVEAARTIRALTREDAQNVPIFAVTAEAYEEILAEIADAGMTGRITKPLNVKELVSKLDAALA